MVLFQFLTCIFIFFLTFNTVKWYLAKPDFKGKVILITGASSGIGEEICKQLCKLNAAKLILCSRRVPELERVKKECVAMEGCNCKEIEVKQLDLSDPNKCLDWALKFGQRVDILINNGGVSHKVGFINSDF